jgi:hypothetical protein
MKYPKQQLIALIILIILTIMTALSVGKSFYLAISDPSYYMFGAFVPIMSFITTFPPIAFLTFLTIFKTKGTLITSFAIHAAFLLMVILGAIGEFFSYYSLSNANWGQYIDSLVRVMIPFILLSINTVLLSYVLFVKKPYND